MVQISLAELEEKLGYAPTPQGFEKTQALIANNQNNGGVILSKDGELLPAPQNGKDLSLIADKARTA